MKTRILAALLAISMLLSLAACRNASQVSSESENTSSDVGQTVSSEASSQEASPEDTDYYPVMVEVYNNARELVPYTFEKCPEKTLVYGRNNVEILLALGLGDKIEMVADCAVSCPNTQRSLPSWTF